MSAETAWLVEIFGLGSPTYYGKTDEGLGLTTDHNAAIRFSRAQDAQAIIEDIGWTEARPIEHMWSGRDPLEDEDAMKASVAAHLAAKSGKSDGGQGDR